MSILCCGLIGALLEELFKLKKNRLIPLFFSIPLILFGACGSFSFAKLSEINGHIRSGKIITVRGKVDKIDEYGGKDIVFILGSSYDVEDFDLYCLSDRNVFKRGKVVELKYVDLGRWAGFEPGNCILDVVTMK